MAAVTHGDADGGTGGIERERAGLRAYARRNPKDGIDEVARTGGESFVAGEGLRSQPERGRVVIVDIKRAEAAYAPAAMASAAALANRTQSGTPTPSSAFVTRERSG